VQSQLPCLKQFGCLAGISGFALPPLPGSVTVTSVTEKTQPRPFSFSDSSTDSVKSRVLIFGQKWEQLGLPAQVKASIFWNAF